LTAALASSGLVRFGYYTSVILLSSANLQPLREAAQYVTKIVANAGFSARVESVNAVEAYLGSMPGNLFANVRRPLVNTLNLAHLLPLTAIWAGPDVHPCPFYPVHSAPLLQAKLFRAVNQLAASTDCAEQRTLSNFLLTLQDRFDWLFDCGRATVTFGLFLCVNGRERFRVGCNNLEQCARRTCGTHSPLFPVLQGLGFDANQVSKTALRQAGVFANRLHVGFRQLLNAHAMHLLATHVPSHVLHTAE